MRWKELSWLVNPRSSIGSIGLIDSAVLLWPRPAKRVKRGAPHRNSSRPEQGSWQKARASDSLACSPNACRARRSELVSVQNEDDDRAPSNPRNGVREIRGRLVDNEDNASPRWSRPIYDFADRQSQQISPKCLSHGATFVIGARP